MAGFVIEEVEFVFRQKSIKFVLVKIVLSLAIASKDISLSLTFPIFNYMIGHFWWVIQETTEVAPEKAKNNRKSNNIPQFFFSLKVRKDPILSILLQKFPFTKLQLNTISARLKKC